VTSERTARVAFGLTSAIVTFGLALQLGLSITAPSGDGSFESTPDRIWNFFSYFTVLSNVTVAATTGLSWRHGSTVRRRCSARCGSTA